GQDDQHDNDQADDVNNAVHKNFPSRGWNERRCSTDKRRCPVTLILATALQRLCKPTLISTNLRLSFMPRCSIQDDYISETRYPLFMARAVLQELVKSLQLNGSAKPR